MICILESRQIVKARIVDLRYRMKSVIEALDRGEPVTVSYRGCEKARLLPVVLTQASRKPSSDPAFGLWKGRQDLADVPGHVRRLRNSRLHDL